MFPWEIGNASTFSFRFLGGWPYTLLLRNVAQSITTKICTTAPLHLHNTIDNKKFGGIKCLLTSVPHGMMGHVYVCHESIKLGMIDHVVYKEVILATRKVSIAVVGY